MKDCRVVFGYYGHPTHSGLSYRRVVRASILDDVSLNWMNPMTIKRFRPYTFVFLLFFALTGASLGDWWSDNGDTAPSSDIDSGARSETTADEDLVNDARGPGQPQDEPTSQTHVLYDPWGRPYTYGMPYGYGPWMGYGTGYMAGPYPAAGGRR